MFLHFKDCKGIIFDVRNNGGGAMSNSDRITQRFLEEKILTGYVMYKKGNGHNDFSTPYPLYLSPSDRLPLAETGYRFDEPSLLQCHE